MQTLSQRWLKICNTVWPNISHLQLDWSKSVELCRDLLRGLKFLVLFILDVNFLLAFYFRLVKFVSEVQVKHSKMNANAIQYVLFFIMILKLCELEWSCTSEYIYRLNFSILLVDFRICLEMKCNKREFRFFENLTLFRLNAQPWDLTWNCSKK